MNAEGIFFFKYKIHVEYTDSILLCFVTQLIPLAIDLHIVNEMLSAQGLQ